MAPKAYKKYALSLIEILVTFALSSIIITLLFTTYKHSSKISAQISPLRKQVNHIAALHKTLFETFSLAHSIEIKQEDNKQIEIHFIFNNGIDPNPNLSSEVKGVLSILNDDDLFLSISSLDKTLKDQKDVLIERSIHHFAATYDEKHSLLNLTLNKDLRFSLFLKKDYT